MLELDIKVAVGKSGDVLDTCFIEVSGVGARGRRQFSEQLLYVM